jgi:hypothetical protein
MKTAATVQPRRPALKTIPVCLLCILLFIGVECASSVGSAAENNTTDLGSLSIGFQGPASYILEGGVSMASDLAVGPRGLFQQFGGDLQVAGRLAVSGDWVARQLWRSGSFELYGGTLSSTNMSIYGHYTQSGGSNYVSGDIKFSGPYGQSFKLTGGVLIENNFISPSFFYLQTGGLHIVKSNLNIYGVGPDANSRSDYGLNLVAGQLDVPNIIASGIRMNIAPGTLVQAPNLTLADAKLLPATGNHAFGTLTLDIQYSATNSTLLLPSNAPCVVQFQSTWKIAWPRTAVLTVTNWAGSLSGNGMHQIIFGTNRLGITPLQLAQIHFQNPAGYPGTYPACVLPSGEIVPWKLLERRRNGQQLELKWGDDFVLQSAPDPKGPYTDVGTALSPFTVDLNQPRRFFRLRSSFP